MKEFLISLFMPMKMKKYRFMSVFVSMLIFVISIYLVAVPNKAYMKMHKEEYLSQKAYVNAYMNLPEIDLGTEFKDAKYKVEDNKLVSSNAGQKIESYKYNVDVEIFEEDRNINIYIVFDKTNYVFNELDKILKEYKEIYPNDSAEKCQYASYIYFTDMIKLDPNLVTNAWKQAKFLEIHDTEEKVLQDHMNTLTNFDLFNVNAQGNNNFLLIFMEELTVSQISYYDQVNEEWITPALTAYYASSNLKFDFSNISNLNEFGTEYVNKMFKPLSESDHTKYLLQVLGYVIIFPAIFALLLCWSMRKRGIMKTYKEYYNIASISSIIPAIITFIVAWFVPNIVPLYGILFFLFVLMSYIKINSTPEMGD